MSVTVGTYNLMKMNPIAHGIYPAWANRSHKLIENIRAANLDVVCVQEMDKRQIRFFVNALGKDYEYVDGRVKDDSGVGVFYRRSKFSLLNKVDGIFRGSRQRAFVQVDLQDKTSGLISRVASVHLYTSTTTPGLGLEQLKCVKRSLETRDENIAQVILGADMNSSPEKELRLVGPVRHLSQKQADSRYEYTLHTQPTSKRKSPIDYIAVGRKSGRVEFQSQSLRSQHPDASDHDLVGVIVQNPSRTPTIASPVVGHSIRVGVTTDRPVSEVLGTEFRGVLQHKLTQNGYITRQDVLEAYNLNPRLRQNKNYAEKLLSNWIAQNTLVACGQGVNTVYRSPESILSVEGSSELPVGFFEEIMKIIAAFFTFLLKALGRE